MNIILKLLAVVFLVSCCFIATNASQQQQTNDGQFCDICTFVVQEAEQYANQSEPQIEQALLSLCSKLPGTMGNLCNTIVLIYGHQIIDFILKEENPHRVCCQLHLCADNCTSTTIITTTTTSKAINIVDDSVVARPAKGKTEQSNEGFCDLCTFAVDQVEKFLAQNQTEEQIKASLSVICNTLPATLGDKCQTIVKQYVPYIIYYLESEFPPKAVCQIIGLCKNATKVTPIKKSNDGACDLCKFGVSQIEAWVASNTTEQMIQKRLGAICSLLPGAFKDQCNQLVAQVPSIITFLEQAYTPEVICQIIGVCPAARAKNSNDAQCDLCKFAVGQIEAWVASNTTEQMIQKRLGAICSLLPGAFKDQCNQIVAQVPSIISFLEQAYTPEVICQMIGVCPASAKSKNSNDAQCDLCKFGVSQIEAWVASNTTEQMIQKRLGAICSLLPAFQSECNQLVAQVPAIITFLEQQYTPEVICQLIGICSSKTLIMTTTIETKVNTDVLCPACLFVVGLIEQQVQSNHTVGEIEKALDKVCNKLPHPFADACVSIVNTYTPEIVDLVMKKLDPSEVCKAIKLCKESARQNIVLSSDMQKLLKSKDSTYCPLCIQIATFLEEQITAQSTVEVVINALKAVCDKVPENMRGLCKQVVPAAYQELIKFILAKETPKVICQQIQMCSANEIAALDIRNDNFICGGCKQLVHIADQFITQQSTEAEITKIVSNACNFFPDQYKDMCKSIVEQYGPGLIEQLVQKVLEPTTVCTAVHACPTSRQVAAIMMK